MSEPAANGSQPALAPVARLERALITVMFFAMIVIGMLQIISRYAISLPISRTEMLLPNIFIVLVFLSLAMTFRLRENIAVTLLPDSLTGRARQVYVTAVWLVSIAFLAYLAVSAIDVLLFQLRIDAVTNVGLPAALITAAVPIGCALSIVRIVQVEILPLWRPAP